jgi:hypothetical protein
MARQNATPQRLVMGPWSHVGMRGEASYTGDVDFGPESRWGVEHYHREQLRFFDRWLKRSPTGVEDEPPVHLFVMGGGSGLKTPQGKLDHGGRWRREQAWPLARTRYTKFYLHGDGRLALNLPDEDAPPSSFTYDPGHPVPTIGGSLCGIMELAADDARMDPMWRKYLHPVTRLRDIVAIGPLHQQETPDVFGARPPYPLLADRSDVLAFETTPLAEAVEVTGSSIVELWVSSSAVDTDFTAKLVDVCPPNEDYPSGYHMNLVDSIIRTRYRNGWERAEFMELGQVYRVRIHLPPTSNLFQAGHRIRVDISSSNFPRLDLNPNTGEPVGRHTHTVVAHNWVYVDHSRHSHIVLPIIPT